jgi:hypothetical protein
MKPLARVLLTVILGDSDWFEVLRVGLVGDACGEGEETVAVIVVVVTVGTVPSPRFNNKPRVAALIDFFHEVDRGRIMEVGLEWSWPWFLASRWLRGGGGLLYFLFIVATRGRVALIALVVVVPPTPVASSRGATDQRSITMLLRPRELILSGRHWMLPIELHEACGVSSTAAFVSKDWMGVVELRVLLLRWRQSAYCTCDPRLLQRHC